MFRLLISFLLLDAVFLQPVTASAAYSPRSHKGYVHNADNLYFVVRSGKESVGDPVLVEKVDQSPPPSNTELPILGTADATTKRFLIGTSKLRIGHSSDFKRLEWVDQSTKQQGYAWLYSYRDDHPLLYGVEKKENKKLCWYRNEESSSVDLLPCADVKNDAKAHWKVEFKKRN